MNPIVKLAKNFSLNARSFLSETDMKNLFSEAEIICEKKYGFTKSVMAFKSDKFI